MSSEIYICLNESLGDLGQKLKTEINRELELQIEGTFRASLDNLVRIFVTEYRRGFVDGFREAAGMEVSEPESCKGWKPKRS